MTARSHGRIVETVGDGVLVEFPSVVDALRSALAVPSGMAERNRNEPEVHAHQLFRVGINLGDVIVDNGDIFGGRREHCSPAGDAGRTRRHLRVAERASTMPAARSRSSPPTRAGGC